MFESVTTTAECHETLLIDPLTVLAERICKLLNDFDIIALQEVPCTASNTPFAHGVCSATAALSTRRNTIVRAAHEAGLVHSVLPPAPAIMSRQMVDSGLVILSRFPITKQVLPVSIVHVVT